MQELIDFLERQKIQYNTDEPLCDHTSFKIGGPCDVMVFPTCSEEIRELVLFMKKLGRSLFVLGNGSNLLFHDRGFRGVVMKLGKNFSDYRIEGNVLWSQSGALLSKVCKKAARKGLGGSEFATGIPGTVGGGIVMNAGAYDGELKDVVRRVRLMDRDGNIFWLDNEEMQFGYRRSIVSAEGYIVLEVEMELIPMEEALIWAKIDDFTARRWSKQPLDLPSAGSTFKRPTGYYAGKLIQDSGLKGIRYRNCMVSDKHSGFIVNLGGATSNDIRTLVKIIQRRVEQEFEVKLETEMKIIEEDDAAR